MGNTDNTKCKKRLYFAWMNWVHRLIVLSCFILPLYVTYNIFYRCLSVSTSTNSLISIGAIFATFGSAIASLAIIFNSDKYERFKEDLQILYEEIIKCDKWRRWPFIKRNATLKLFNDSILSLDLKNPRIPFEIGSHKIEIEVPTTREDFYDLSLVSNFVPMIRFRKHFITKTFRDDEKKIENINLPYKQDDALLVWDCIFDIWKNIFIYKALRVIIYIGVGFVFSSVLLTFCYPFISKLINQF